MADGTAIAYRLWKPAAPRQLLVLLHGVGSNSTRWSEFVAETSLSASWDLLRLDLRGHGGSLHRGRIGMAEWCSDLAAILAQEGYAEAVVAGHCLGADIATAFAVSHPRQTAGLVLIEPMFRPALIGSMWWVARFRSLWVLLTLCTLALNAMGLHRRKLPPLDLEALDRETRTRMAEADTRDPLARYASPLADLRTTATSVYLQGILATTGPTPDLGAIRAPVLALITPGSGFSDPAITRRLLEPIARHRIVTLEARHWIPTEQPQAMLEAIESWCLSL